MWCFAHFDLQMCLAPQRHAIFWHLIFKSGPNMWCFAHFDLQIYFSSQRRAIFGHRNFKNCSAIVVFCTFWMENALRATAACHFWTKLVRDCGVLYILTWKCASRHSASKNGPALRCFVHFDLKMRFSPQRVPFFIYLWNSYLRTRRFSEATFRTSGTTNHWENIATSLTFGACGSFFLVTLLACWSSFCWLDCSTLLFNSAYCRKLDF